MPKFDDVYLSMTKVGSSYNVPSATVYWRGPPVESFSVHPTKPLEAVDGAPLPGGEPFSTSNWGRHGANDSKATLTFNTSIGQIADWHDDPFDGCRRVKLWMKFQFYPPRAVLVHLSCVTHPALPEHAMLLTKVLHGMAAALALVVHVLKWPFRRLGSEPAPQLANGRLISSPPPPEPGVEAEEVETAEKKRGAA